MEGWPSVIVGPEEMWEITLKVKVNGGYVPWSTKTFIVIAKTEEDALSKMRFNYTNEVESVRQLGLVGRDATPPIIF